MAQARRQDLAATSTLIALGANLPNDGAPPEASILAAISELCTALDPHGRPSRLYWTPCFPPGAGPDYVNAALAVQSALPPRDILALLHRIEADHRRERVERWGARTLDLDLIAVGETVLPDERTQAEWRELPAEAQRGAVPDRLILPHPRIQDRAFVLVPLAEVAPGWRHPLTGRTVAEMLAALPEEQVAEAVPV